MNRLKRYFNNIKSLLLKDVFYNHSEKHSHYEEEIKFFGEWIDSQLSLEEIAYLIYTINFEEKEFLEAIRKFPKDEKVQKSANMLLKINKKALNKLEKQKKLLEEK